MNDSSNDVPASDAESAAERNSYLALSNEAMETMFGDESHLDTMRTLRGQGTPEARLVDATWDVIRAARRKVPAAPVEIVIRVAGEVLEDAVAIAKAARLFPCEPETVLSTRLGEYKQARRRGIHPRAAAYMGREVSTDFGMRGDSKTLGFFYDTVMFLRPAVVSMDRLFRGLAHDPNRGAIAAKTAAIALASAVLFLMNRDHEEYKDLEDWDRDNYWHFFIPGPGSKDLHFRYPKIWEIGAIASLAERSVERFLDKEPKKYAADFTRVLGQAFHLNLMPQVLAPLQEQITNRDSFTGHPIEPRGLEALQPFLRAKPYTSETLRQLGMATKDFPEALQVNPVRTEALLTGYLNTWAMYGLMLSDSALFPDQIPERRLDQYPVIRRFFRQDPPIHTQHEKRFYELLDETRRLRNTMRELDRSGDDLDLSEDDEASQDVVRELEKVQRDIVRMRREADEIRRSDLSPADKRRELDAITAERNAIFKEVVNEIQP